MHTRQSKNSFHHYILSSGSAATQGNRELSFSSHECEFPFSVKESECEFPFNARKSECEFPFNNEVFRSRNQISQQLEKEFCYSEEKQKALRYKISIDFSSKQPPIHVFFKCLDNHFLAPTI